MGFAAAALVASVAACSVSAPSATVTAADADRFLADANQTLLRLGIEEQRAGWVAENFITTDTEALAARADQILSEAAARLREGVGEVRPRRRPGRQTRDSSSS